MAVLRHPTETTLAATLRPVPIAAAGTPPQTPASEPPAPLLRGDPNSPLSVGLETACWPQGFKMPEVTPFQGCTDPSEFLWVYETAVEAAGGDDTTKAKIVTLALKGVALTWFFTIPHTPYMRGNSCETSSATTFREITLSPRTQSIHDKAGP